MAIKYKTTKKRTQLRRRKDKFDWKKVLRKHIKKMKYDLKFTTLILTEIKKIKSDDLRIKFRNLLVDLILLQAEKIKQTEEVLENKGVEK